jgi:hypothetical protein
MILRLGFVEGILRGTHSGIRGVELLKHSSGLLDREADVFFDSKSTLDISISGPSKFNTWRREIEKESSNSKRRRRR